MISLPSAKILVLVTFAFLARFPGAQGARFPQSIHEAHQAYSQLRDDLIEVYVDLTETQPLEYIYPVPCDDDGTFCIEHDYRKASHPFGAFNQTAGTHSFRRIAAYLLAYKKRYQGRGDYRDLYSTPTLLRNAPQMVTNWTQTLYKFARTGSETHGGETDYDMIMKEMITLLYLFKNESSLLTDDAAFNIVDKGLVYRGNAWEKHMRFKIDVVGTYPESENHVLMTLSSIYLTNQWIYGNPRGDKRLTKGDYRRRNDFKNSASFEDMLLQTVGRIVHADYFETNARPYQVFTFHCLFNLYLFANSPAIREGARNAIDFTLTKFAFQSYEGKRLAPQRRQSSYRDSMSMYSNDGTNFMVAMLSGYFSWNASIALRADRPRLDLKYYFPAEYSGNAMGHMFWAALFQDPNLLGTGAYSVPAPIHDFLLRKRRPYWARMQARFTERNYAKRHWPRYFVENSTALWADVAGLPREFAAELYFGASHTLNVAGGRHNDYPLTGFDDNYLYDFTHKPSYVMPSGHVRDWGEGTRKMAADTLITSSGVGTLGNNLGTYKGFTWGYSIEKGIPNTKLFAEPFVVPKGWAGGVAVDDEFIPVLPGESNATAQMVRFRFYDRSSVDAHGAVVGFYLVTGGLRVGVGPPILERSSVGGNRGIDFRYVPTSFLRGFWEVVPADRFPSFDSFRDRVLRSNPSNKAFGYSASPVQYNSTTGELLELFQDAGYTQLGGIAGVVHPNGTRLSLTDVHADAANVGQKLPLIDVTEVDSRGLLTGTKYAYSRGDGYLEVRNPFIGGDGKLCIDSRDYRHPRRGCSQN